MGRPDHFIRIRDRLPQRADQRAVFFRVGIADRVRHVDRGGASDNRGIDTFAQEVELGPGRVLCAPLDIIDQIAGLRDRPPNRLKHGIRTHFQLVLHMHGAGGDEGVDTRAGRRANSLTAALDIAGRGAGKAGDHGCFGAARNLAHGFEIASRSGGETCLDDVHAHRFQQISQV